MIFAARIVFVALVAGSLLFGVVASAIAQTNAVCPGYSQHFKLISASGASAYSVLPTDQCKLLVFTSSSAATLTLPAPKGSTFLRGFMFYEFTQGAGTVTLSAGTGSTINGGSTLSKAQGVGAICFTDGANWECLP